MKVRILSSGFSDLVAGRDFYEKQEEGLGTRKPVTRLILTRKP